MSGLFVDLSDYEVMEKLNELQVDFFVEADEEDSSFFKGFVNCRPLPELFTTEENAHRGILADVVGWEKSYEDLQQEVNIK